ncbi:MAG: hypothetical protein WBP59_16045 [Ilumatobacteraceae bacterium]
MAALPLLRDVKPRRASATAARPPLKVVERRRRWPAVIAGTVWALVFLGLLGAAVFHTQLAGRQLRIDRLDRAVTAERERFDELRYQRAELRSPVRLAAAAGELGMHRGQASTFVSVDPLAVARQLAAAGPIDDQVVEIIIHTDPLDQFRAVKEVTEVAP